jgi:hypothetical protein
MAVPVEPVTVDRGDRLRVRLAYRHFTDWDRLRATVERA